MIQKKQKLKAFVTLVLSALILLSCSPQNTPNDPNTNEPEQSTETQRSGSMKDLLSNYTIVYPTAATQAETDAAMKVFNAFGRTSLPKADFVGRDPIPHNNNEILIGKTNRASSQAALENLDNGQDYSISFYDGEVVITAKTDAAIMEAVDYFIASVLPANALLYPDGFVYTHLYTYPLTGFFGLSLNGLEISYSDISMEPTALLLQSYILDSAGVAVDVNYLGDGNVRLALDQTMDKSKYAVDTANGIVTLRAGSELALSEAVREIVSTQKGNESTPFEGLSRIPVTISDPKSGKTLELVWHDEFDGKTLNNSYWTLQDKMWKNTVTTTTDKENIALEDGEVVMRTYKKGSQFYSHKTLTTADRMSFQYGYLEICAKIPFSCGSFPAFWLQSAYQHRSVDYMTEVDVFEVYKNGYVEGTMHKWYLKDPIKGGTVYHCWNTPQSYTFPSDTWENLSDEYHLWGFGWTSTVIYFTLDGKIFATYDITDAGDFDQGLGKGNLTGMGGFQDPMIINFTNWIGSGFRDPNWVPGDDTEYPLTFSVKWIRLYQDENGKIFNDMKR